MNSIDVAQAWKSESYRATLSDAQLSMVPQSPAGVVELSEAELTAANGGATPTFAVYSFLASAAASVIASFAGCTGD